MTDRFFPGTALEGLLPMALDLKDKLLALALASSDYLSAL